MAQADAVFLGEPHETFARAMQQLGVGGKGDRLLLHGRINDHLGKIRWLRRARARGNGKALLNERDELLLAHPLAPARQRGAVESELVPKELFATEELIIGIFDPALAQNLVREIVHVFEDGEPGHQPRGQRRASRNVGVDRAEAFFEKVPINGLRKLRQSVVHIDDLIKPRLEQIVLTAVPPLLRPHRITSLLLIRSEENHGQRCRSICKKIRAQAVKTGKYEYLQWPKAYARSNPF